MHPESRFRKRVLTFLRVEVGGWWTKVHGGAFQTTGLPDLIGAGLGICPHCGKVIPGHFTGLELKLGDREVTPRQLLVIRAIRVASGTAKVVRDEVGFRRLKDYYKALKG